ncbi:MAG: TIGR00282 family metallophosphoesterase [Actinobacteria bacterium]|nr:TIGR00282 family metallophosphoesterase [Actinomycetota bacterium]
MRVLFLGDIFGKPGRECVKRKLPDIVKESSVDIVIANGENAAGGLGITPDICNSLLDMGIDVVTSGNHIYKKREIYSYIEKEPRLLKPANYPPETPGSGFYVFSNEKTGGRKVAVINICGRIFIENYDCPFRCVDKIVNNIAKQTPIIIVDFHGEATSEKLAMAWFLDGRVSAVVGTHTHVQTADERILPGGTAYITDVGMVGPMNSVIGMRKEIVIERFLTLMPQKFKVANENNWINAVLIDIDDKTGKSNAITRLNSPVV